jgi:hypothetical protein
MEDEESGYRFHWGAYGPYGPWSQAEGRYFPPRAVNNPGFLAPPVPLEEGGLLPSYEAACDLYRGDPTAIQRVGLSWLTRAAMLGAGLRAAGMTKTRDLVRYSLAGSAAIELFVLGWVWKFSPSK